MVKNKKKKVQCLIFSKKSFPTRWNVKEWIKKEGFKVDKRLRYPIMDDKNGSFRVIQRNCDYFNKNTFKVVNKGKGVKGVTGYLK